MPTRSPPPAATRMRSSRTTSPSTARCSRGSRRCRIISVTATGWDCVDVAAAAERGIRVAAVGEYCTDEVADHTLALMLASERRLRDYDRQVQVGARFALERGAGAASPRRPHARDRRLRPHRPGRLPAGAGLRPRRARRGPARGRRRSAPPRRGTGRLRRTPRALGHHHAALQPRGRQPQPARSQGLREDEDEAAAHQCRARRAGGRGRPRGSARPGPAARGGPRRAGQRFAGSRASSAHRARQRAADASRRVLLGDGLGRPAAHLGGQHHGVPRRATGAPCSVSSRRRPARHEQRQLHSTAPRSAAPSTSASASPLPTCCR